MGKVQQAANALAFLVSMGEDFAASLKAVAERFGVNPDIVAYEFDAINNDQWRA